VSLLNEEKLMYMNPKIRTLFSYADAYELMLKGSTRICRKILAHQFVDLICTSRCDLIFLLNDRELANLSRIEQLKLLKIICDIYGLPSSWRHYEGNLKAGKALLTLEKQYKDVFKKGMFFDFSYGFADFHDHLDPSYRDQVDEDIIMLADRPLRPVSLWLKCKWKVESLISSYKRRNQDKSSDIPF
jgi:hypothetical protein